jgi:hypothetical protein
VTSRKAIVILSLIIVVLAGLLAALIKFRPLLDRISATSSNSIVKEILPVSEYTCLLYRYTTVVMHEESKKFNEWELPFTKKKYIYTYDGMMKLGINGKNISIKQFGQRIQLHMPPVQVVSHIIDERSIKVYDQTRNAFNQIEIDEAFKINAEQKAHMEAKAQSEGVFEEAQRAAEQQFGDLLKNLPGVKNEFIIEFVW